MMPHTRPGRTLLAVSAVLGSLVGGPLGAMAVMAVPIVAYVLQSPDRAADALYLAAFCGVGAVVGR